MFFCIYNCYPSRMIFQSISYDIRDILLILLLKLLYLKKINVCIDNLEHLLKIAVFKKENCLKLLQERVIYDTNINYSTRLYSLLLDK